MPKVSVIVPIYNVEKYLEKCLESLVNQTLEEIQIVLVNDGTKDNSGEIAKQYKEKHPEKIIYLEKENGGLSDARNFGMSYSTGEYVAFLDADDYVELNLYEEMYNLAQKEKSDMVECDFIWEYQNKSKEDKGIPYEGQKEMIEKVRVVAWNKLIKREVLEKAQICFPKGYRYEDVEFTYKLIPYLQKVSFLKKPYIHYMQREGSISKTQNEKTKHIFDVLENVIEFYKEKGLYEEYKMQLEYIYTRYLLCSSLLRMVKIKDKNVKKELLNKTWTNLNTKFPKWKENEILKSRKDKKKLYIKTVNKFTYAFYCKIFSLLK